MPTTHKLKAQTQANPLLVLLNQSLAEALDLKLQAKQAHWNVKGENFIALHELFDKVAAEADEYADLMAERVLQLGGTAAGTLQEVAKRSRLPAYPAAVHESRQHVAALGLALGTQAEFLRRLIDIAADKNDAVTADLLTEITRGLDKLRWLVLSHQPA